jgi:phosphotransferase system, enzyme I, PtsP
METATQSARDILTGLHEIMASKGNAQAKLDKVVEVIGGALASEVCSIYLLRDGALELFATRGLNEAAVHVTRLGLGEGLVGTIADNVETLNLDEAASHPNFRYMPETGEERFHSFAGVPIIRSEKAVGVVCVQHVEPRKYLEVEIEALQTVAMVLAELIANANLIDPSSVTGTIDDSTATLSGLPLVKGMAAGVAIFHKPNIRIEHTVAEDIEAERHRVYSAFDKMREQIDRMTSQADFATGGEHEEVLATYKMFAYDEGWSRRINEAIDSGLTAEAAIERVQQRTRMRMRQIDDPLLADRMHDLEDLANRLLRIVSGQMSTAAQMGLKQDSILIARNMGPAELLEYDKRRLRGVVLEEGSLTAHVTIVARAMGIPVLGRVEGVQRKIRDGDMLLLNADEKSLIIRPSEAAADAFQEVLADQQKKRARYAALRDAQAVTTDGERITLMVNAGLRDDVAAVASTGADGVGLFRTEFQFLISATLPQREKQQRFYREVLDSAGDKPVIFRTIDVGGDKALPYIRAGQIEEENPALGWRAVRLSLDQEGLMKAQARALLEASAGRTLNVMFPMLSEPWEFDACKAIFDAQLAYLTKQKKLLPTRIRYGAMLEVPALADALDILLPKIDFLSIGTNDLTQFLFAADRADPRLAERYDWLSPAILRFIRRVVKANEGFNVDIAVCGEMGGRPLEALALIGIGIKRLSITPAGIGPIKAMVRSMNVEAITQKMEAMLTTPPPDFRENLALWAKEQGVEIG